MPGLAITAFFPYNNQGNFFFFARVYYNKRPRRELGPVHKGESVMKKRVLAILAAALLLSALTACGGSGGADRAMMYDSEVAEMPMAENDFYDYYGGEASSARTLSGNAAQKAADSALPQKIIRTADLEMETTTFEETAAALADLTERLGGYFADSTSGERGGNYRWASYTIRIPAKNFSEFLEQAGGLCHETHRHVSQQDVSDAYYDTEGRVKTQTAKRDRLTELLAQAEDMADIITIESAIFETEEQIEELQGTLSRYDNLVDYATVELSLTEVYRFSNVEELPVSYTSRIASAFTDGLRDFGDWIEDVTVAIAYNWVWLLLLVAVAIVVVMLGRAGKLRLKRKQNARVSAGTGTLPEMVDAKTQGGQEKTR